MSIVRPNILHRVGTEDEMRFFQIGREGHQTMYQDSTRPFTRTNELAPILIAIESRAEKQQSTHKDQSPHNTRKFNSRNEAHRPRFSIARIALLLPAAAQENHQHPRSPSRTSRLSDLDFSSPHRTSLISCLLLLSQSLES